MDGMLVGGTYGWDEDWSGKISNDTHLIAVACANTLGPGGLLVSIGNLLVSNAKWKCSRTAKNAVDWYKVNFNDSAWNNAFKILDTGISSWGQISSWSQTGFSIPAQWIWADENWKTATGEVHETIYCRRKTGKNVLR